MREIQNPKSAKELKNGMEMENWRIGCYICDAEMWVHVDINGDPHLMRQGTVPYEVCPTCSEIHRIASN